MWCLALAHRRRGKSLEGLGKQTNVNVWLTEKQLKPNRTTKYLLQCSFLTSTFHQGPNVCSFQCSFVGHLLCPLNCSRAPGEIRIFLQQMSVE